MEQQQGQRSSPLPLLLIAVVLGLVLHGSSMFFTLEKTYDALIHLFFADHYASSWWEPWNQKWYTGFTVTGYPPLVHQLIALFSLVGGLKFGLFTLALLCPILFITGVYRYSYLLTQDRRVAGYSALFACISTSFTETLHVFGQLPSIIGISVLMHALPHIYRWLLYRSWWHLIASLSLIAITVASHHVTPIFGMIFFIFPVIGLTLMDHATVAQGGISSVRFRHFLLAFRSLFWRIVGFGMASLFLIISVILPYWINSKNNPISQVPIPHGSRDNFLEVLSSGFIFFILPWGLLLLILPYFFYRFYRKRLIFFGISFTLLFVLGTGGTTPIPRALLGETAFNILTLDRFTLWASILVLPLVGEWINHFLHGDIKEYLTRKFGAIYRKAAGIVLTLICLSLTIFTITLFQFRPSQPDEIEMLPIVNFLNQDDHDQWRYMTLGFGDQMAWLATQTDALSVDGNYHSARRLPELISRAVERLENSKFLGIEGIGSLQQFMTIPHKYNLKYIFSNDKFYDPILHFTGWHRLTLLENGIQVWERLYVPPLPNILPKDHLPVWQKTYWGTVPLLTILLMLIVLAIGFKSKRVDASKTPPYRSLPRWLLSCSHVWVYGVGILMLIGIWSYYQSQHKLNTPSKVIKSYYNAIDFKDFNRAYTLLDPNLAPPIEDYLREISVSDGVLNSYAKMNALDITLVQQSESTARAKVTIESITPLKKMSHVRLHQLSKVDGQWYIQPPPQETDLPPNLYHDQSSLDLYLQGRRKVGSGQTYREDILSQPEVIVSQAALVQRDSSYSIIGVIQNIDNLPANVSILGSVYTADNVQLASYNAMYTQKHILLPKESTIFRIDFEDTAWSDNDSQIPSTFDPSITNGFNFSERPVNFDIHLTTNVAATDLYRSVSFNSVEISQDNIRGVLYNSGTQEVTIPQLLIGYYQDNTLLWASSTFLESNIRQQRKVNFQTNLQSINDCKVISSQKNNTYCNGTPIQAILAKNGLTPSSHDDTTYPLPDSEIDISLDINTFIGNPK